jgi:hypothetical protein
MQESQASIRTCFPRAMAEEEKQEQQEQEQEQEQQEQRACKTKENKKKSLGKPARSAAGLKREMEEEVWAQRGWEREKTGASVRRCFRVVKHVVKRESGARGRQCFRSPFLAGRCCTARRFHFAQVYILSQSTAGI